MQQPCKALLARTVAARCPGSSVLQARRRGPNRLSSDAAGLRYESYAWPGMSGLAVRRADFDPDDGLVCTVGKLSVWPGASNVIAGSANFTVCLLLCHLPLLTSCKARLISAN